MAAPATWTHTQLPSGHDWVKAETLQAPDAGALAVPVTLRLPVTVIGFPA